MISDSRREVPQREKKGFQVLVEDWHLFRTLDQIAGAAGMVDTGVLVCDEAGTIYYASKVFESRHRFGTGELVGRGLETVLGSDKAAAEAKSRILQGDHVVCDTVTGEGTMLRAAVSSASLDECTANHLRVALFREAGEAQDTGEIREGVSRLQSLMDTVTAGIIVIKDSQIRFVNAAMERFLGCRKEEVLGLPIEAWSEILDPVSRKFVRALNVGQLEKLSELPRLEACFRRTDGAELWGAMTVGVVQYEGGSAVLATITDITDSRQMEIALRDNEERFRALSQMVSLAILIIQDWRILYVNPAGESLMGYSREALTAMSREEWTAIFDPQSCQLLRSLETDQLAMMSELPKLEASFRVGDGSQRWGAMSMGILEYGGNLALLATIFDVTERKRAEEKMSHSNRELGILNAIAAAINNSENIGEMLETVVKDVLDLTGMETGAVYLADPCPEGTLTLASFVNRLQEVPEIRGKPLLPGSIVPAEAKVYRDVAGAEIFEGATTSIAVPLLIKDKLVGLLALHSPRPGTGGDEKASELLSVGSQLAMAIENHSLFLKIQETSRYLSDIINEAPDAMLIVDKDGVVRSFNKSASRLLKYTAGEVIGRKLASLLPRGEVNLSATRSYIQEFKTSGGDVVQLSVSVSRMNRGDEGSDYIVTLNDLSEISGLKITPITEQAVDTAPIYSIESGTIYLTDRLNGEEYLEVFADQVKHSVQGLCVTRQSPLKIRQRYGLEKTPVIWLTGMDSVEGEHCIKPDNLSGLGATLHKFLSAAEHGLILIDGLEYLISRNNFDALLKFIHYLNDRIMLSKCSVLIVIDSLSLEERQYHMLASELTPFGRKAPGVGKGGC